METEDFKRVTDALTEGAFAHMEVAAALGVDYQHYRQMRLPEGNPGRRPYPPDWRERLAPLAAALRQHSNTLAALADRLDPTDTP